MTAINNAVRFIATNTLKLLAGLFGLWMVLTVIGLVMMLFGADPQ
jgi:type IV secretory pathway VirB2 component (pilin)